jgi:hypothetical protein
MAVHILEAAAYLEQHGAPALTGFPVEMRRPP